MTALVPVPPTTILDVGTRRLTLRQLARGFGRWLEAHNAPLTTRRSYGEALSSFLAFADRHAVQDPEAVTVLLLDGFFLWLREGGRAPATVSQRRSVLISFWRWLEHEGFADRNMAAKTYPIKVPKRVPGWLEPHQIHAFLEKLAALRDGLGQRDYAIVAMFFYSGLRVSELVALHLDDIDIPGGRIRVQEGKGGQGRLLYMVPRLAGILETYLAVVRPQLVAVPTGGWITRPRPGQNWRGCYSRDGQVHAFSTGTSDEAEARAILADRVKAARVTLTTPYLFLGVGGQRRRTVLGQPLLTRSVWEMITTRAHELLGVRISPHKLRHTCASYLIYHGAQLETIQRLLGHADIRTTMIYLHVPQQRQEEELARIFGKEGT